MQRDGGASAHAQRHAHQPEVARDQDSRTWRPGDAVACNTPRTRRDYAAGAEGVDTLATRSKGEGFSGWFPRRAVLAPTSSPPGSVAAHAVDGGSGYPQHHTRWFSADIATHERGAQQDCTSCHEVEVTPTEVQRGADWGGVAGPVARTHTVCPVFALGLTRR